jgi:hypothetical protein
MFKVHAYCQNERVISRRMQHLPRVGDTLRIDGKTQDRFLVVTEVVWCLNEESMEGTRVNMRLSEGDTQQIVETKQCQP